MEKDLLREIGMMEVEDEESEAECEEKVDEEGEDVDSNEIRNLKFEVENAIKEVYSSAPKGTSVVAEANESRNLVRTSESDIIEEGVRSIEINRLLVNLRGTEEDDSNVERSEESAVESHLAMEGPCDNSDIEEADESCDSRSMHSITTVSTIAPELIKRKVKVALQKREKGEQSRRIITKGEANAVTRTRRENRDTIKQSTGIWGWE